MIACFFAVYIYVARIIHRTEVQKNTTFQLFPGNGYAAFIPDRRNKILIGYSRKFTFGTERNNDLFCVFFRFIGFEKSALGAGDAEIEFKKPFAVEILPIFPLHHRLRMFGTGNFFLCHKNLSSSCILIFFIV